MPTDPTAHESAPRSERTVWLLLTAGFFLTLVTCSGAAMAIVGAEIGKAVAVTIAILGAAFAASCGVGAIVLRMWRKL